MNSQKIGLSASPAVDVGAEKKMSSRQREWGWFLAALTILTGLYLLGLCSWFWPRAGAEREAGWPALIWSGAIAWAAWQGVDLEQVPLLGQGLRFLRGLDRSRLGLLAALFVIGWGGFAVRRYDTFAARAYDLAIFDQAIWATAHGKFLFSSIKGDIVLLGDHASPILAMLAPLYWLVDDVRALLWLQAIVLAYGAFPIHRLARRFLGAGALSAIFPVAYLLQMPMRRLVLNEFHPEIIAVPCLLLAIEALLDKRWWRLACLALVACACKETTALAVAGLGLVALGRRAYWPALALIVLGVAVFAIDLHWIIPHYLGQGTPYTGRYSHLGHSLAEVLSAPIRSPHKVLLGLVWPSLKIEGLARLLFPYGFLSLWSPAMLWGALPNYLVNAMSNYPSMWSIRAQYHAEEMVFVAASGILGAAALLKKYPGKRRLLVGVVASMALAQTGQTLASAWAGQPITERSRWIEEQLSKLPADIAISADSASATHLAHRLKLFHFPDRLAQADCAVVNTREADHAWHISPEESRKKVAQLPQLGFGHLVAQNDLIIACRK